MRPFPPDSVVSPRRPTPPLVLLFLTAGITVGMVAVLPRVIVLTVSLGTNSGKNAAIAPNAPAIGDNDRITVLVRASDLLQVGGTANVKQAARLLDGLPNTPLFVQGGNNTDSSGNTPFSSTLLIMRLGRQMGKIADAPAYRTTSSAPTVSQRADALQWTYRCRRLADAVLGVENPSIDALKVAHYMDTIASRSEIALYKAWKEEAGVQAATRQRDALRRVWNEQIMPLLADESTNLENGERGGKNRMGSAAEKEADWATHVSFMVVLYQKDRPIISMA